MTQGRDGIHVQTIGSGPWLVLLHGYTGSKVWWEPFLDDFASNYTVIVPDLPGHGRSETVPVPYRFDQVGSDVLASLDALGVDRFRAIGRTFTLVGNRRCGA